MGEAMVKMARPAFGRLRSQMAAIQEELRAAGLDGWLLHDLRARNPVTGGLTGIGDQKRRYFVWLPAEGEPVAVVHAIEEGPWAEWPWRRRRYSAWRELDAALGEALAGSRRIAMEVSPRDAVPFIDLVPAGVVELIRSFGPEIASSGDLATRFHSVWTAEGLASHRRAAAVLADVAREAFDFLADGMRAGETMTERRLHSWVIDRLAARGCAAGADCIAANGVNAADAHYAVIGEGATFRPGDVVLLDLWAKEAEDAIFADQTWIAYLGDRLPERVHEVWTAVRDARDAAVEFLRQRSTESRSIQGYEVDDAARAVIAARGFGPAFVHRTGHSIDQGTHGMGPNLDNLETHETRTLIQGVGFSIEPGIYLPGEIGLRSEINVYMGEGGPEVTPSEIQREAALLPLE